MKNFIAKRFQQVQDGAVASAAAEKNQYPDLIDLTIGDTDLTTDERIIRAAMEDALAGHTHYTNPQGDPELIDEIRKYYQEDYNLPLTREEVFISTSSCLGSHGRGDCLLSLLLPLCQSGGIGRRQSGGGAHL